MKTKTFQQKMVLRKIFVNKVVLILTILSVIIATLIPFLQNEIKTYATRSLFSILLILGLSAVNLYVIKFFDKLNLPYSKNFSNLLYVLGFLVVGFIVLRIWDIDASFILQSSVLLGLILGLALQPVLSNLFAGIIILSTRYVEVGKHIRIISSQIPYGLTPSPAYKFLSVEKADLGYKGLIKKVTLFYSIFQSDEGREIKIPNSILLNSLILEAEKENLIVSIRVEFPLRLKVSLEKLEDEIRKVLKGFKIVEGPYFNEQSDKEYVFITLKIESQEDWKKTKSEALKKLLMLKEKIKL
jgi:small-conductance mechanosensitive channel